MQLHLIVIFHLCGVLFSAIPSTAQSFDVPLIRNVRRSQDRARRDLFGDNDAPFYFADVSIGTPAQKLTLLVDTSTSTTMASGKDCTGCSSVANRFNAPASSTSVNKSTALSNFPYGDGSIQGYVFADTMQLGGYSVPKSQFLKITDIDDTLPSAVSGILGLAFAHTGETTATPFWQALTAANASAIPEVGFWLSRALASGNVQGESEGAGVFTLGGVNASLFSGDVEFLGLAAGGSTLGFWMLDISTITVGGKSIDITPNATLAMFDTSLDAIYGPEADVRAIYAAIPGSSEPTETIFQFPCNTTVKISVSFGGQAWSIDPQDMNQGPVSTGSSECFGALGSIPAAQSPSWRFGVPFLRNVYSVFRQDPPAVGFAELSTIAGGVGVPNATVSSSSTSPSAQSSSPTTSGRTPTPSGSAPPDTTASSKGKLNTGAIAGGVIAGVAAIIIVVVGFILYRRRRRRQRQSGDPDTIMNYAVSAFPRDIEASLSSSPSSAPTGMTQSGTLTSSKRTAVMREYGRLPEDRYVMTQKGLQLTAGTTPHSTTSASASLPSEASPSLTLSGAQAAASPSPGGQGQANPNADPVILQELQTLRDEVRWLVHERSDPPPIYT